MVTFVGICPLNMVMDCVSSKQTLPTMKFKELAQDDHLIHKEAKNENIQGNYILSACKSEIFVSQCETMRLH